MTLSEAIEKLPNGLHDAVLHRCSVDYTAAEAEFRLSLWVGTMDQPAGELRERLAPATLKICGLQYCVIEPPDTSRSPKQEESTIDVTGTSPAQIIAANLPKSEEGCFTQTIYVFDWNSFIYLSASSATLTFESVSDEMYVDALYASYLSVAQTSE